jgi:eukaryotic-like serine/threonine-protein kinase
MDDQLTGQMLAQYKIEGKIGQGGMGAVYRAWDTLLRRQVAIKILEAGSGQSGEKRARFLMEARAVAALNHPNIVTIYEIGQSEAVDYIAMEFVPGRTLHALIQAGPPMVLDEVLGSAIQVADAVAAAHAAGITHRDLKPANIMVSDRGRLKVLDFGIAKRTDQVEETEDTRTLMEARTQRGHAVGTPHYMSPEQAQGKPVDGRSDIFAFGAILYEMLTGRRAFPGDSLATIMVSILTLEPPPVSAIRPIPEELDRLIVRCLRKDVERRIQHAGDLKLALEELRAEFGASPAYAGVTWAVKSTAAVTASRVPTATLIAQSGQAATPVPPNPQAEDIAAPKSKLRWAIGGACLLAAVGFLAARFYWKAPPRGLVDRTVLTRMTSGQGLSVWPALSRDGKFLAFASDRPDEKNLHIWVRQLGGGGQAIQLTHGQSDDVEPDFSPDGASIAFRSHRAGGGIYIVPTLGGEARLLAKDGLGPKFSPDGKKIAYCGSSSYLGSIYIVDANGGSPAKLFQQELQIARFPIWSPDGKFILFEGGYAAAGSQNRDWWIAPAAGGKAVVTGNFRKLRDMNMYPSAPAAWLPDNRLLFAANVDSIESLWTVKVSASGKSETLPQRLTFGTTIDDYPAATGNTPESLRIAFSSITSRKDLWVLPIDSDRGVAAGALSRLTQGSGTQEQLTMSMDGRRIAFLSDRDGKAQPWVRDLKSGRETSATDPNRVWAPFISPDGKVLAWSVYDATGRLNTTYRASIGAGGELGLTELLCQKCGPVVGWSPDGRKVVFNKPSPSRAALLELDTGNVYDLLGKPDSDVWGSRFSPDGKWLTMNVTPSSVHSRIYVAPFDPQRRGPIPFAEWIPVTDGVGWDDKPRWSPDSKSIYFISERDGFRCIWRQRLDPVTRQPSGAPAEVAHFHQAKLSMRNLDLGPLAFQVGQDKLIFSLGEISGNVWMLLPGGAAN